MATNVYVDGFNLYYGCVKGTPYRWLDLEAFCARLLPRDDVGRVRYFTALVGGRPDNVGARDRQKTYLRALATLPRVTVHFGHFLTNEVRMRLAHPRGATTTALVVKTEEKGSDVNLASHLLLDLFKGACDTVVVVSNDSDLTEPLRMARYELGATVGVVNPHPANRRSRVLSRDAHFFKQVRPSILADCQLPSPLRDADGMFHKPAEW